MTLAGVFSGAAEGHALIYRHVISDNRGFTYNDACSVVDEKAPAYLRGGMNLYPGFSHCPL